MTSIRLNSNGTQLLAASNPTYDTGLISLMDIPNGNVLQGLKTLRPIKLVDWRKDVAQVIAVLDGGGIVQSYTAATWTPLNTYEGYAPSVYSPDGTKLAVSLNDYKARILDVATGTVLQTITVDTCPGCNSLGILGLQWSPDSSRIAVVSPIGGKIRAYNILDGNLIWEKVLSVNFNPYANSLIWSPDGKRIAAETMFFDANTGDTIQVLEPDMATGIMPRALAWSPDSRYLLTQKANQIEIRNATSGRKVLSVFELPAPSFAMSTPSVTADWNLQSNRIAITDGQSSVYVYKFSQP